jgi:hypothetical protein
MPTAYSPRSTFSTLLGATDRTLAMVYFNEGELEIMWVGNHQDYERKLKNNKNTIRKFLKDQGYDI